LKILNYFKSKQPFRIFALSCRNLFFPHETRVQDSKSIGIEVVNICNCKCIFCAYRLGYRKKVFMTTEVFKDIVESAVKLGYENLDLTPLSGEFFIHNNAVELE
jgi:sulfatase maturation enzyme AslB (radical SAM superfamily)